MRVRLPIQMLATGARSPKWKSFSARKPGSTLSMAVELTYSDGGWVLVEASKIIRRGDLRLLRRAHDRPVGRQSAEHERLRGFENVVRQRAWIHARHFANALSGWLHRAGQR